MPISPTFVPTDFAEIGTNLGVLIIAIGAAVAGIFKGIQNTRKLLRGEQTNMRPEDKKQVLSAAIIETISIQQWTEQNHAATEQSRTLCLRLEELIGELRDHRGSTRDFNEEARKLRLVVADLVDVARGLRK